MGNRFYGLDKGDQAEDVAIDTSTQSKDIELNIDDAVSLTKLDVLQGLEKIKQAVQEDSSFPGA